MSTRSSIARATAPDEGVYVHNDGYAVGEDLKVIARDTFCGDIPAMLDRIVDSPTGWSTINHATIDHSHLEHARPVPGIGTEYTDSPMARQKCGENDFTYVVDAETGHVEVWEYRTRRPELDFDLEVA